MAERKSTQGQTTIYKNYTENERSSNRNTTKNQGDFMCSGRVTSVTLVTNR
jgi:hypothetical protein